MEFILTRYCLQKGLAFLYIVAFLIVSCQYLGLYGKQGLLPLEKRKQHLRFWQTPSLFCVYCSDRFLRSMASAGLVLALFAFSGYSESMGLIVSMVTWFLLWALYQSFVNVGEVFYGFGWEILLLEAGFLAIFLGSAEISPPLWIIWLYRFLLFRVMLGAGLIKMRGDACWKDLTALMFHYETQPLPGPLSCFFHRMPAWFHRGGVLVNHFVELIVPFFFFWPEQAASVAALITIGFQGVLILSGNLSWLNYITIVISFSCLGDTFWSKVLPWMTSLQVAAPPVSYQIVVVGVTLLLLTLSIRPMRNLVSPGQRMNCSFDPLHLVNTYGAFGSMTRVRREIILEGTRDTVLTPDTVWTAYEFKAKPGSVTRRPRLVSPYHYKLDWQMWFAAMTSYIYHPWLLSLVNKILENEPSVLHLLKENPFYGAPPAFVRAELYEYHFAPPGSPQGVFWVRERVGSYLPPLSLTMCR